MNPQAIRDKVPPRTGAHQEQEMIHALERAVPSGPTGIGSVLNWISGRLRRRGIVAIFSDFFDDEERLIEGTRRLLYGGHEPILFQVLDPQELEFDYEGLLRLDGLESLTGIANFLLCRLPDWAPSAAQFVRACREHGLYIRDAGSMGAALADRFVRIAVKDAETNRRMTQIVRAALGSAIVGN